jgi:hypothetical protein
MDEVFTAHVYTAITNHKSRISYVEREGEMAGNTGLEGQYFGYSSISSNKGSWEGQINKSGQDEKRAQLKLSAQI